MFKNIKYACIALGVLAVAQTAQAAEMKLGFVNLATVMSESPQVQEVTENLRKAFQIRSDDLQLTKLRLEKDRADFTRDSPSMSQELRQHTERALIIRERELRLDELELKEEIALRRTNEMEKVKEVIRDTISQYGKKNKFYMIFYDSVAYADEVANVTDDIIDALHSGK